MPSYHRGRIHRQLKLSYSICLRCNTQSASSPEQVILLRQMILSGICRAWHKFSIPFLYLKSSLHSSLVYHSTSNVFQNFLLRYTSRHVKIKRKSKIGNVYVYSYKLTTELSVLTLYWFKSNCAERIYNYVFVNLACILFWRILNYKWFHFPL